MYAPTLAILWRLLWVIPLYAALIPAALFKTLMFGPRAGIELLRL